jgi:hypothetical protein
MTEFDRLASQVYTGLRDGALDAEATFDLACFLIGWDRSARPGRDWLSRAWRELLTGASAW